MPISTVARPCPTKAESTTSCSTVERKVYRIAGSDSCSGLDSGIELGRCPTSDSCMFQQIPNYIACGGLNVCPKFHSCSGGLFRSLASRPSSPSTLTSSAIPPPSVKPLASAQSPIQLWVLYHGSIYFLAGRQTCLTRMQGGKVLPYLAPQQSLAERLASMRVERGDNKQESSAPKPLWLPWGGKFSPRLLTFPADRLPRPAENTAGQVALTVMLSFYLRSLYQSMSVALHPRNRALHNNEWFSVVLLMALVTVLLDLLFVWLVTLLSDSYVIGKADDRGWDTWAVWYLTYKPTCRNSVHLAFLTIFSWATYRLFRGQRHTEHTRKSVNAGHTTAQHDVVTEGQDIQSCSRQPSADECDGWVSAQENTLDEAGSPHSGGDVPRRESSWQNMRHDDRTRSSMVPVNDVPQALREGPSDNEVWGTRVRYNRRTTPEEVKELAQGPENSGVSNNHLHNIAGDAGEAERPTEGENSHNDPSHHEQEQVTLNADRQQASEAMVPPASRMEDRAGSERSAASDATTKATRDWTSRICQVREARKFQLEERKRVVG